MPEKDTQTKYKKVHCMITKHSTKERTYNKFG